MFCYKCIFFKKYAYFFELLYFLIYITIDTTNKNKEVKHYDKRKT